MKTERSKTQKTQAARKDDDTRADRKKSRDPDAFERLLDRGGGKKPGDAPSKPGRGAARRGELADVGDEESWRGRVVDGEVQMTQREERRGQVRSKRSSEQQDHTAQMRERRIDEGDRAAVRDSQQKDRTLGEVREKPGESSSKQISRSASDPVPGGRDGTERSSATTKDTSQVALEATAKVEAQDPAAAQATKAEESSRSRRAEVADIAQKIVESARTGFDAEGRKLLTMTMDIPGRGRLEIRMRKHGSKMQVELAADSPAFGRLLRRSRKDLKQQTRQRGVQLSSVRVAR